MERPPAAALAVVLAATLLAVPALASGGYALAIDGAMNTPDRTVTLEGSEFVVRGLAVVDAGDRIDVQATVPDGVDNYQLYVYGIRDGERTIVDATYVENTTRASFDTTGYDAGSYVLTIHAAGDYRAIFPVVVEGATLAISTPRSVPTGESLTVTADLRDVQSGVTVTGVDVVLVGPNGSNRVDAPASGGGYAATIPARDLERGTYRVYAVAQTSGETPTGEREIVAVSAEHTIEVTASSAATTTTTTTRSTRTSATTTTTTARTPAATSATTDSPPTTTAASTPTTSTAIQPNPPAEQGTSPAETPGFSAPLAVGALVATVAARLLSGRRAR